jgi:hypothetical protein
MGAGQPAGAEDFVEQFGIETLPPPDPADPSPKLRFCCQFVPSVQKPSGWPAEREFAFSTVLDHDQVLIWFDLNRPINLQLRSAKELLNGAASQRNPFRVRSDQYSDYLRLLDAKEVHATHSQIASILYKRVTNVHPALEGNRRVRKDLKIAERLRDQDYWRIAAGVK